MEVRSGGGRGEHAEGNAGPDNREQGWTGTQKVAQSRAKYICKTQC